MNVGSMHTASGRWKLGLALTAGTCVLWGVGPVAMKAVLDKIDPYTVVWCRFAIAAAIMLTWALGKYGRPRPGRLRGPVGWLLLAAVGALTVNYGLFMNGLSRLPPGVAVVTVQLAPLFMLAGGVVVFREPYRKGQLVGLAMLVIGLGLFFNNRLTEIFGRMSDYSLGLLLVVGAALTWAAYSLTQKQLLKSLPSEVVLACCYLGGTLFFLPASRPETVLELDAVRVVLLVFCGLVTVAGFGMFAEALKHLPVTRVSAVIALIPLVTLAVARIVALKFPGYIPADPLNLLSLVGAIMVVTGSMTSSMLAIGHEHHQPEPAEKIPPAG